ncbi:hypothetical protein QOT17_017772 [Balamuthia mandrillaris]
MAAVARFRERQQQQQGGQSQNTPRQASISCGGAAKAKQALLCCLSWELRCHHDFNNLSQLNALSLQRNGRKLSFALSPSPLAFGATLLTRGLCQSLRLSTPECG